MAARPLRIDRNATASALAHLRTGPGVASGSGERGRLLGLLVEAQRRLKATDGEGAEAALREALALAPEHADALNLLSVALGQQGRAAKGERASRRALAQRPDDPRFLLNLANRLKEQERDDEAIAAYRAALAVAPADPAIIRPLARLFADRREWPAAVEVARHIADAPAASPDALVECAKILALGGAPDAGPALYERALEQEPERAAWWLDLARLSLRLEHPEATIAACERVLALEPEQVEPRVMMAAILFRKRQYARMHEVLDGISAKGLDAANAVNLAAMSQVAHGRIEDGLESMRMVADLAPDASGLQMTRIMYLNYHPDLERAELFAEHRAFGERFSGHVPAVTRSTGTRDPERRLRIGYVSPDFRAHSVAYFVAPIFQAFDRERFETIAYAHVAKPDQVTAHLQGLVSDWRDVTHLDDRALAERIGADEIDILVDLGGYTANTRLLACTARPAPIQMSYIGYPNTTGLSAIDYRITDHVADPDDADDFYTETLIRLPRCFLAYALPQHAPPLEAPPCDENGFVTFGSFNNLAKVNRLVIGLWADVLARTPGSRLLLKSLATGEAEAQDHIKSVFADAGIDPSRVEFAPYAATPAEHLATYNRVDIALDTLPYNGTTTTCEALWMGVPVITLAGDRHAARVGASLLSAIGFDAGITASPEDYCTTAALLASHPELLRTARRHLRQDLCRSPICDMAGHARALEEAYRAVWRIWCETGA